jgi:hypothetical protein
MHLRLLGALAVVAIVAAGCGSDNDADTGSASESSTTTTAHDMSGSGPGSGSVATESAAAGLRDGLTALLQEHVFLAGATTSVALSGGDFKVPAAVLDKNSVALSEAVGSVYGKPAGDQFLALWRKHIGFFVDYTTAAATGNAAGKAKANADLDQYRADFDAFLTGANPNLPKGAVAADLIPHVKTLEAAIDAQAAKDPSQFDKLKEAADHMPMTAAVLAGAIAKQKSLDGNADGPASTLRSTLTAKLQEHVYLAGFATGTALGGGDLKPAAAALDENSVELAGAIESVYGKAAGDQFLALWRKHIGFFVDYTTASAAGNAAGKAKAVADLDQYRADFDAFLTGANPNLPKGAVAAELIPHVQSLALAVDAQAAKDPSQYEKLAAAAAHMPMTAKVLAGAIAKQYPDKFGN